MSVSYDVVVIFYPSNWPKKEKENNIINLWVNQQLQKKEKKRTLCHILNYKWILFK